MRQIIDHVDVYTPSGIQTDVAILIDGNSISQVGTIDPKTRDQVDKYIDGQGMLALPGLVNSHTHVAMTLFRSYADDVALMDWLQHHIWPAEEKLTDELVYWGSQLAFAEMIRGGTTAFCDMYMHMDAVAQSAIDAGIRGTLARGLAGVSPNGVQALAENVELFRRWDGVQDGLLKVMLGPHAPYTCPADYIRTVADTAKHEGIEVHIHLSETRGEVDTCYEKHGMSPIAWMEELGLFEVPTLAAHCVHVDANDIDILARHDVRVAHNPRSNLKLASGIAPLVTMREKGIVVGLGTDGCSSNNKLDMFEEMQLAALLHKGNLQDPFAITAKEAIHLATKGGAQAIGYKDKLGTLEVGMLADIILLNRTGYHWQPCYDVISSVVYSANSMDVDTVFINGRMVMHNREILTIDIDRVREKMNQAQQYFSRLKK